MINSVIHDSQQINHKRSLKVTDTGAKSQAETRVEKEEEMAANKNVDLIALWCFNSSVPLLDYEKADQCFMMNTSEFQLVTRFRAYLFPIKAELMILLAESYAVWIFGSIVSKRE